VNKTTEIISSFLNLDKISLHYFFNPRSQVENWYREDCHRPEHADWLMMTQDQAKLARLVLVGKNWEEHYRAQLINFKNVWRETRFQTSC